MLANQILNGLSNGAKKKIIATMQAKGRENRASRRACAAIIRNDIKLSMRKQRDAVARKKAKDARQTANLVRIEKRFSKGDYRPLPGMTNDDLVALGFQAAELFDAAYTSECLF